MNYNATAIVWGLILLVETWVNPGIDKSNPITPFYDSLYWSFGSALDPGEKHTLHVCNR